MKIGIVTDSTACINLNRAIGKNIKIVYLNVIVDDVSYKENLEITNKEVFEFVDKGKTVTTSQPTPKEFLDIYNQLKDEGYTDVFSIHLSSNLSGTFQSAKIATNMIEGINIHLFDTESASIEEEIYIDKTLNMIEEGLTSKEIIEKLNYLKSHSNIYITVDDLSALVRGGRLNKTQALLGTAIQLKPLLSLENGTLKLVNKIRTKKKVILKIIDDIKNDYIKKNKLLVHITHVNCLDVAQSLKEKVQEISPNINVKICEEIGPVLSVHFGRGGFGVAWTKDQ